MFSEKDLVARTVEEMQSEVEELLAEAERLGIEHKDSLQREMDLRTHSVESRPTDAGQAEKLWQEAEELHELAREMLRLAMEKRLRAADIQHKINVHNHIKSLDVYDDIWRKASQAARSDAGDA